MELEGHLAIASVDNKEPNSSKTRKNKSEKGRNNENPQKKPLKKETNKSNVQLSNSSPSRGSSPINMCPPGSCPVSPLLSSVQEDHIDEENLTTIDTIEAMLDCNLSPADCADNADHGDDDTGDGSSDSAMCQDQQLAGRCAAGVRLSSCYDVDVLQTCLLVPSENSNVPLSTKGSLFSNLALVAIRILQIRSVTLPTLGLMWNSSCNIM